LIQFQDQSNTRYATHAGGRAYTTYRQAIRHATDIESFFFEKIKSRALKKNASRLKWCEMDSEEDLLPAAARTAGGGGVAAGAKQSGSDAEKEEKEEVVIKVGMVGDAQIGEFVEQDVKKDKARQARRVMGKQLFQSALGSLTIRYTSIVLFV